MATQGGPARKTTVVTDGRARASGPAIPVAVVADGRAVEGARSMPVYIAPAGAAVAAGPALPVVAANVGAAGALIEGGPAQPVYVVSGFLPSNMGAQILALSPIAYWPLDDTSGSVATDRSGNGRDGAYANVTLGQPGVGDGRTAAGFNGTSSTVNVQSASLAAAFNGAAGTLVLQAQVSAAGVWTDGANRRIIHIQADASNRIILFKETTNDLRWLYVAGGTSEQVVLAATPLGFFQMAITWDKAADQVKAYYNGAQTGATQTTLGTWVGALTAGNIGSASGGAASFWSGSIAGVALFDRALSAAQIAQLAVVQ